MVYVNECFGLLRGPGFAHLKHGMNVTVFCQLQLIMESGVEKYLLRSLSPTINTALLILTFSQGHTYREETQLLYC